MTVTFEILLACFIAQGLTALGLAALAKSRLTGRASKRGK